MFREDTHFIFQETWFQREKEWQPQLSKVSESYQMKEEKCMGSLSLENKKVTGEYVIHRGMEWWCSYIYCPRKMSAIYCLYMLLSWKKAGYTKYSVIPFIQNYTHTQLYLHHDYTCTENLAYLYFSALFEVLQWVYILFIIIFKGKKEDLNSVFKIMKEIWHGKPILVNQMTAY